MTSLMLLCLLSPGDGLAFVKAHCVECHGPAKKAGGVRLDDLPADPKAAPERWLAVRDQVRDGLMPPAKRPRPDGVRPFVASISAAAGAHAARLPNHGNLIPHELLFGKPAASAPPPPRVWRLSPDGYLGLVRDLFKGNAQGITQPFSLVPERGIRDFAGLYTIDEPSTEILLRNAEAIVDNQFKNVREFKDLGDDPTPARLAAAVQAQFRMAIGRAAAADEVERFVGLYGRCAKAGDRAGAAKTMPQAVLLKTDAMFRSELGRTADAGRRRLAPHELAVALSLSLRNSRDPALMKASEKGDLSRDDLAAHVRRLLADPRPAANERLLSFFREYFGYANAANVFKDRPKAFMHVPGQLVADTDRLILHTLAADKDVFRTLLTTDHAFVNYGTSVNKKKGRVEEPKRVVVPHPQNNKGQQGLESVYGVGAWAEAQPMRLPEGTRLGVLMQPSWLVAFSTNFDNDPVRRGRWVRERLLGGVVPELPIGVAAQVPDDPHRTFRDRLTVTRDPKCWKCHRQMDDLGLAFEQFDHYGRFRTAEAVVDAEATRKNVDKKGKALGVVLRDEKLDTAGGVSDSGDAALDGAVKDPRELVRRLAASGLARQVFVRHAFRFFLGRNETLSDARTLQEADAAYVKGGGSFAALVTSLLTSESFLYRSGPPPGGGVPGASAPGY